MDFIGILLILDGIFGIWASTHAFGDIGVACMIAGIAAFLSGIGMILASYKIRKMKS